MRESLIIFDGDDTLWLTEPLYDAARRRAASVVARRHLDAARWLSVQQQLDLDRVRTHGFSWRRFPGSCALAVGRVAAEQGRKRHRVLELTAFLIGMSVFFARPAVVPGAVAVLSTLRRDARVVLLTKGQRWVQRRRVRQSGLAAFFDAVEIVDTKTSETFRDVVARYGGGGIVVSVGNSMVSDVTPALRAGLDAVLIDSHVWAYETEVIDTMAAQPTLTCADLRDVPGALASVPRPSGTARALVG